MFSLNFTAHTALIITGKIAALSVVFQTIELLMLRHLVSDMGVWSWKILREEFKIFPKYFRNILDFTLSYPAFIYILWLRLLLAMLMMFFYHSIVIGLILLITILISLRWRGVFNGGSDYMTIVVFSALFISSLFESNELVALGCIWYIAIQSCSSYFISGLVKIKKKNWRTGKALMGFLNGTIYEPILFFSQLRKFKFLFFLLSWLIIIFELSFPLIFFNSSFALFMIFMAFIFHIGNFYIFGLNRFIYIWSSTYPAIIYLTH